MTKLYLVVPCYNEEEVLFETSKQLLVKIRTLQESGKISGDSRVVFVDDGSKDKTWDIIKELHLKDKTISGIKLSRNRGHQNALLAGLSAVVDLADAVISLDADLQDDINAIDKMLEKYVLGNDIVYGVRSSRKKDTFFKRFTAEGFYKIMSFLGADVVFNHADYRLLSAWALEGLLGYKEVNLFLRGIIPLIGYRSDIVTYERKERFAGESKYPLRKMLSFAFEGITSLSVKPIRLIFSVGLIIFFLSIIAMGYCIFNYTIGNTVSGWTSLIMSIWLLGGLQLIAVGVIGEYIGKVYLETKERPKFIIEEFLH